MDWHDALPLSSRFCTRRSVWRTRRWCSCSGINTWWRKDSSSLSITCWLREWSRPSSPTTRRRESLDRSDNCHNVIPYWLFYYVRVRLCLFPPIDLICHSLSTVCLSVCLSFLCGCLFSCLFSCLLHFASFFTVPSPSVAQRSWSIRRFHFPRYLDLFRGKVLQQFARRRCHVACRGHATEQMQGFPR